MKFEVKWSVAVFFALIAAASATALGWPDGMWAAGAITASVLLHEFGHVAVARGYGIKVKAVGLSLKGGYTVRSRTDRKHAEALTTLAGPAVNFLLCGFFFLFSDKTSTWIAGANLVLAVANLVPLGPSDGLRLLRLFSGRT